MERAKATPFHTRADLRAFLGHVLADVEEELRGLGISESPETTRELPPIGKRRRAAAELWKYGRRITDVLEALENDEPLETVTRRLWQLVLRPSVLLGDHRSSSFYARRGREGRLARARKEAPAILARNRSIWDEAPTLGKTYDRKTVIAILARKYKRQPGTVAKILKGWNP